MDLAVSYMPDTKFCIVLLVVGHPEINWVVDLGVALLILGVLSRTELLHLGVILRREIFLLFG
jgi:hypothetical protein